MNIKKYFFSKKPFEYIAWFLWFIVLASVFSNLTIPLFKPVDNIQKPGYMKIFMISLICVALIQSGATILFRYYALIRPNKKGSYTPYQGPIRFVLVGLINWIFADSIAIYGIVVFFISGQMWPVLFFGLLSIALLFYHCPRLGQFGAMPHTSSNAIDASFTQVK
jgi:hypothetical protein